MNTVFVWCPRCAALTEHHDGRCLGCGRSQRLVTRIVLAVVAALLLGLALSCSEEAPVLVLEQTATSIAGPDAGTRLAASPLSKGRYRFVAWVCSSAPDQRGPANARLNPDGLAGPVVPTPLCPEQIPATWEGQIAQGVNVTLLAAPLGAVRYTAHLQAWALP